MKAPDEEKTLEENLEIMLNEVIHDLRWFSILAPVYVLLPRIDYIQ